MRYRPGSGNVRGDLRVAEVTHVARTGYGHVQSVGCLNKCVTRARNVNFGGFAYERTCLIAASPRDRDLLLSYGS